MPEQETRFSDDQARDPNGKFASGSQSDPHTSKEAKQAGPFVDPHAGVMQEHMDEFLKEGNVEAYAAFKVAQNVMSGTKVSKELAESTYNTLSEHVNEAMKEGNHPLVFHLSAAMAKLNNMRSLSQESVNEGDTMKPLNIERRYCTELRVSDDAGADQMVLQGYAARYNSLSKDLGGFREMIAPGAFTRTLASSPDVVCLFNHGMKSDVVLGRTTSGTLAVTSDDKGLFFRCQLDPNQQSHRDLHSSVKRGDVNECSFAFAPNGDEGDDWKDERDAQGNWFISRTLKDVNLFDVSAVTRPAYNSTSLQARSEDSLTPRNRGIMLKFIQKRNAAPAAETRDQSVQDALNEISKCLAEKFPCDPAVDGGFCSTYGQYYMVDTFEGYVIACNNSGPGTNDYFRIPYVANPDGTGYVFGTPVPVEKEWVPSERSIKLVAEGRAMQAAHLQQVANAHKSVADEHQANADAHSTAADAHTAAAEAIQKAADAKKKEEDAKDACDKSDGDCEEKRCMCQNRMSKPEDVYDDYDESDSDDENERAAKTAKRAEFRAALPKDDAGLVRTKLVGDKNLAMRSFAHAGDADKTESWKLPTHDADHATRSFGRVDAAKVPADKLEEVRGKLASACAAFGAPPAMIPGEDRMSPAEIETMNLRFRLALFSPEVTGEVRYSDDQPRDSDGKWGSGGDHSEPIGKTSSGKDIPGPGAKVYNDRQKMPKYNGPVSPANAHGRDGGKMLKERMPEFSKVDHLEAHDAHMAAAESAGKDWDKAVNEASQSTFGRPYSITDYKVSGVARDEFSKESKDKLRDIAHTQTDHKEAAMAHWYAAGKRS